MAHKAPGRSDREGMTILDLMRRFPTEDAARNWFEQQIWPDGRYCPHCGSTETFENPASESRPYRCKACGQHFSVRLGTVMERSKISLQKWAIAIYLHLTSLKGVSSMKLHRDIGVTQKTAWFMLQRIRKAWESEDSLFTGPIEVDETYMGGKERNKHKGKKIKAGRGTVGKTAVVGAKDHKTNKIKAAVVKATDAKTLQGFVKATDALLPPRSLVRPSILTTQRPTRACPSITPASATASASMSTEWPIPTELSRSGRCSSVRTRASITRSAPSTCNATWTNSRAATVSGNLERSTRCNRLLPGWSANG